MPERFDDWRDAEDRRRDTYAKWGEGRTHAERRHDMVLAEIAVAAIRRHEASESAQETPLGQQFDGYESADE